MASAREAQVHEALLRERFEDPAVAATEGINELLARFARHARRLERRAARAMVRARTRRLLRALDGEPPLTRRAVDDAAMLAWARARIAGLETVARSALERAHEPDPDLAHRARIAIKICRYTRERLAAALDLEPRAQLTELTEAQERLGKVHDLATFAAALERDRDRAVAVGAMARARAASTMLARVEREVRDAREALGTLELPPLAALEAGS
jgi:CHAD domain-containing protein